MDVFSPKACAVRERTGDGVSVGRCCFHVGNDDVCPRHGNVSAAMARYRETGKLTDENELPKRVRDE